MRALVPLILLLISYLQICDSLAVSSTKPGADIRLTRNAISHFGQIGADFLTHKIENGSVMDRSGWAGLIKYEIFNVTVSNLEPLGSSIPEDLTRGIVWELGNVTFDLNASYRFSFWIFKSEGSFRYSVQNTTLYLPLTIGVDKSGQPTLKDKCRFEAGTKWSLTFYGRYAGFYNWLAKKFRGSFGKFLENMICSAMSTAIQDLASVLNKYPVTAYLGSQFAVDYKLLRSPVYKKKYMDVNLKGQTYWKKKRGSSSVKVPDLPPFNQTSRMIYYFFTDYVFNTLAQAAFKQDLLEKLLTYKDLPRDQQYFLNTTCPGNLCFGKLIAQTATMFPGSRAELNIKSSERPVVSVSVKSVAVAFSANIEFNIRFSNGSTKYIFAIKTTLDTSLHILADDIRKRGRLAAAVDRTSLSVGILDSKIGAINLNLLNTLMDTIVNLYVRPQLNRLGTYGYPLPSVSKNVTYQNPQVILSKNAVIVGANLKYSKTDEGFGYVSGEGQDWMQMPDASVEEERDMSFQVVDGSDGRQPYKINNL